MLDKIVVEINKRLPLLLYPLIFKNNINYVIDIQSFGSQQWDTGFAIQALLASNLTDEIGPVLARGHDFVKKSQV